jgi:hypothetical protein
MGSHAGDVAVGRGLGASLKPSMIGGISEVKDWKQKSAARSSQSAFLHPLLIDRQARWLTSLSSSASSPIQNLGTRLERVSSEWYASISSVESRPTKWRRARSPPGWEEIQLLRESTLLL